MNAPLAPPTDAPIQQPMLHDCVIQRKKNAARARVMPVPPEEFGISRYCREMRTCNYAFHRPQKTEAELIAQGYDPVQVKALPSWIGMTLVEEIDRDTVQENQYAGDSTNQDARQVEIVEHYCRFDYEGNGDVKLYKIVTGGSGGEVLRKTVTDREGKTTKREDIEEMDMMPFAAMTPVPQTHRFFGRSIADLVMEIQKIKTALLRGALDNTYLRNNPRPEVSEQHATPDTMDDLYVARPGAPIRVRQPGGINWNEAPDISGTTLPMIEYMDQVREMRTGVTRQGQGIDSQSLQNQSATAVNQVYSMAQARMKLIARIFAETGIKDLFWLLHAIVRKHGQQAETVRLRNKWVAIDPRNWKARDDLTVHVGLGNGSKAEQLGQTMQLATMQKELLLGGKSNIVQDSNLYETCKQLVKLMGEKSIERFFTDPKTVAPPPPPPPDPKIQIEQMRQQGDMQKMQAQAQLDQQKMAIDAQHQAAKNTAEAALAEKKFQLDRELAMIEAQLKVAESERNHALKLQEMGLKAQEAERSRQDTQERKDNTVQLHGNVKNLHDHVNNLHNQVNDLKAGLDETQKAVKAPRIRTAIRDEKGKLIGARDELAGT